MEEKESDNKLIPICRIWTSKNREICFLYDPKIRVTTSRTHKNLYWDPKFLFNGKLAMGSQYGWASCDNSYNFIEMFFNDPVVANILYLTGTGDCTYPPTSFEILASNDSINYDLLRAVKNVEWKSFEDKSFHFQNTKKYRYYQINLVTSNSTVFALSELNLGYVEM